MKHKFLSSFLLIIILIGSVVAQEPDCPTIINQAATLLDQAGTMFDNGDLTTGKSLVIATQALMSPCLENADCVTLPQVNTLLDQVGAATETTTASALLDGAEALLTGCVSEDVTVPPVNTSAPIDTSSHVPITAENVGQIVALVTIPPPDDFVVYSNAFSPLVSWSADSSTLAYTLHSEDKTAANNVQLYFWSQESTYTFETQDQAFRMPLAVEWSPSATHAIVSNAAMGSKPQYTYIISPWADTPMREVDLGCREWSLSGDYLLCTGGSPYPVLNVNTMQPLEVDTTIITGSFGSSLVSYDERYFVSVDDFGTDNQHYVVRDMTTGEIVRAVPELPSDSEYPSSISSVNWSPTSHNVIVEGSNEAGTPFAGIWHFESDTIYALPSAQGTWQWSPDGSLVAMGRGKKTLVWHVENEAIICSIEPGDSRIGVLDWLGDSQRVLVPVDGLLQVWDVTRCEMLHEWTDTSIYALSPNNTILARLLEDTIELYSLAGGNLVAQIPVGGEIAWSPDSARLAVLADDGTLTIWGIPE